MRHSLLALVVWSVLIGCAPEGTATQELRKYSPRTRTYFVAADEVLWDYAPSGRDGLTGQPFDATANVFVERRPNRIGKVYRKAIYREYTDATFTTVAPRAPEWEHLGMLGPMIRGVVGDTIVVVFKNNARHPYSFHVHGLRYDKGSEGAPYVDGTGSADKGDDIVEPGHVYTYSYSVPDSAGPAERDMSSAFWMYHSHVDEPADTNDGLVGPIVVTAARAARDDGTPIDVDRELVAMYSVIDENVSHYLRDNIEHYGRRTMPIEELMESEEFRESNLMHSINGFVFGNLRGLDAKQGDRVRWYVLGMGTEVDLHTPHWHGNTVVASGMRTDLVELLPASMKVADMSAENPGTWLFHCHVNDHIYGGMTATYRVAATHEGH